MPKVHTAKAAKDYPDRGIKKGDTYYSWSFFRGPVIRSLTPPRRSQITGSANLSAAYAVGEGLADNLETAQTPEDVAEALGQAAEAAQEVIDAYEETISNLEQAFQGGCPALEEAQEKKDSLESYLGDLESAKGEVEDLSPGDYVAEDRRGEKDEWEFDDLESDEQHAMMEAAREIAGGPEFD